MLRKELGQLLNLSIEMIPVGNANRSQRSISPTFVTVHNTSNPNPGADAAAHSRFVREKGFYELDSGVRQDVSWHYTVDDHRVIKQLPINERAIHAGRANGVSIAIEICRHDGIDQAAADLRAARLVAVLLHDLRLPVDNVKPHQFWTGKNCPILLLPGFQRFCEQAAAIAASVESEAVEGADAGDGVVTRTEIESLAAEAPAGEEPGMPPEPDIEDEHRYIAAEVDRFAGREHRQ